MQTQKEAVLAAFRHEQTEVLPNIGTTVAFMRCPTDRYWGEGVKGKDMFGVDWISTDPSNPMAGSSPAPGVHVMEDITEWESIVHFPDLDSIDWEELAIKQSEGIDRSQKVVTGLIHSGMFERLNQLMGMQNALCSFYEEPEAVRDFFDALIEFKMKCIDYVVKYFKPDIVQMHDDWGTGKNTFFSPDIWREFIKPYEKRCAERIHQYGKIYEHHSCGYITTLIDDIVEVGIDAINPVMVHNDIDWIKEKYGDRLTIVGGVNNQLIDSPGTTKEEMVQEVHRAIDQCAPGGSYIFWYVPGTLKYVQFINEEAEKYGKEFYARKETGKIA